MNIREVNLHYVCPRCSRKLSRVPAMESATLNVRRKCGGCGRSYSLTIRPVAIAQGWAHSALITELERRVTVIE